MSSLALTAIPIIDDLGISRPFRIGVDGTVFLISVYFLERAADVFVDSAAVIGKRFGVPTVLVGLLTAGGEWEELVVVVSSLATGNPALALSNTLGSSIANILGSFSIGLVFAKFTSYATPASGSRSDAFSAKIYTTAFIVITFFIAAIGPFQEYIQRHHQRRASAGRWVGAILVTSFVVYIACIAYGIYRGVLIAPEGSDSDSDSDRATDEDTTDTEEEDAEEDDTTFEYRVEAGRRELRRARNAQRAAEWTSPENAPLLPQQRTLARRKSTFQIIYRLITSTILLSLSGYLLSVTSASLATQCHLSESTVGITILSIATTLPEKLVAYKSGVKGHTGVLIANTVGSNIFLQTLVMGVIWLAKPELSFGIGQKTGIWIDVAVLVGSSLVLWVIVWFGLFRRWIGVALFVAYIGYIGSVVGTGRVD